MSAPPRRSPSRDLKTLLASRHQLLVAVGRDEKRLLDLVRGVADPLGLPVWTWTVAAGLRRSGQSGAGVTGTTDLASAVEFVSESNQPGVYVFLDAGAISDDALAARRAKELSSRPVPGRTVILTGLGSAVPPALAPEAAIFRPAPPSTADLAALLDRAAAGLARSGMSIRLSPTARAALLDSLRGLTLLEAERLIVEHTVLDGVLGDDDLAGIRSAKAQLLSSDSPLDLIAADVNLNHVGGLETLKTWLAERGRAFEPAARRFGLPLPRGVLLTGVPGTGKSLVAKAIANSWGMALVALDTGRLHGSFIGESEERLVGALDAVEAMTPVVLWIDEVEKAFAGTGDADGGAAARVLGVLLRWLQERPAGVFVVATSNDVTKLPPELTRRGRFDEVFFVDLPGPNERAAIFAAQLGSRGWDPARFDLTALTAATEGFSGAEIESVVVGALYAAYAKGVDLTTAVLAAEAAETVPLAVLRAEDVTALRDWARGRAVRA
ncbi:MAG: AAA family ATPase [Actinobacteria bacterium]|nr:AAA family ATPase [Actinomycetota bacterium]